MKISRVSVPLNLQTFSSKFPELISEDSPFATPRTNFVSITKSHWGTKRLLAELDTISKINAPEEKLTAYNSFYSKLFGKAFIDQEVSGDNLDRQIISLKDLLDRRLQKLEGDFHSLSRPHQLVKTPAVQKTGAAAVVIAAILKFFTPTVDFLESQGVNLPQVVSENFSSRPVSDPFEIIKKWGLSGLVGKTFKLKDFKIENDPNFYKGAADQTQRYLFELLNDPNLYNTVAAKGWDPNEMDVTFSEQSPENAKKDFPYGFDKGVNGIILKFGVDNEGLKRSQASYQPILNPIVASKPKIPANPVSLRNEPSE